LQTLLVDHRVEAEDAATNVKTCWPPPALKSIELSTYSPPGLYSHQPACKDALVALVANIPSVTCWYKKSHSGTYGGVDRPLRLQEARPDFKPYRWTIKTGRKKVEPSDPLPSHGLISHITSIVGLCTIMPRTCGV
jgi:hypothetical protein